MLSLCSYPPLQNYPIKKKMFTCCVRICRSCAKTFQDCNGYNAYKDPNPPVLFKMVESLTTLQERVNNYLDEWPDHHGLLKILDLINSLLAMPLSTPIFKGLTWIATGKAQTLQENDSKFFQKDDVTHLDASVQQVDKDLRNLRKALALRKKLNEALLNLGCSTETKGKEKLTLTDSQSEASK